MALGTVTEAVSRGLGVKDPVGRFVSGVPVPFLASFAHCANLRAAFS